MREMTQPPEVGAAVAEVLRGNRDAFRALVEAYTRPLQCYIASQVCRLDEVDDLAQEVFVTAYRNLGRFRAGEDFWAWLRGIARNQVLMYFRGTTRREAALERFRDVVARATHANLDRAVAADHAGLVDRLRECIARLPDRLRRVVRAGLAGDKPAEQAAALRTTASTVYNLHYRANRMLRDCLRRGDA